MGEGTGCILLGKYKLTEKGKKELKKEKAKRSRKGKLMGNQE